MATRNKSCPICSRAASKNIEAKNHVCSKNWKGTSTAMETSIILEGFKKSVEMHQLKYVKLIGDGDSSVYKKICLDKPYGSSVTIQKIECTNHLLRNFITKCIELSNKIRSSRSDYVSPNLRKILRTNVIRLRTGIKSSINYHSKQGNSLNEQVTNIIRDIKNLPFHVFGQHNECATYFCKGSKSEEINYIPEMHKCGLLQDLQVCGNRLIQNAHSLALNLTNNPAETYNSVVSKFVGGKRINFSIKNGYDTRCRAAGIRYNAQEEYIRLIHSKVSKGRLGFHTRKYSNVTLNRRIRRERRTLQYLVKRVSAKRKAVPTADQDYGMADEIEDMDEDIYINKKEEFLRSLQKTKEEILNLEIITRGQSKNVTWRMSRNNLLTASNFGTVCKLRSSTNPRRLIQNILSSDFKGSVATRWGNDHEEIAKAQFEETYRLKVKDCGLFVCEEYLYLGASPDGVIDQDTIIEIKCPYSARFLTPEQAVVEKKIKYLDLKEGVLTLKKNHDYFFQIQGQLAISKSKICFFIVWTPLGMLSEKILFDQIFWENALKKLTTFYLDKLLKEIVKNN